MESKICKKCGENKNLQDFSIIKTTKYYEGTCKLCRSSHAKKIYQKNKLEILKKNKEYNIKNKEKKARLDKEYALRNKEKLSKKIKEYYKNNKEKLSLASKKYYEKNKEKIKLQAKTYKINNKNTIKEKNKNYTTKNKEKIKIKNKTYRDKNKEKIKEKDKSYRLKNKKNRNIRTKKRMLADPLFKFKSSVHSSILSAFRRSKFKKSTKTIEILGCSMEFFKSYISSKFEPWMTFDNHGNYNKNKHTWQLDHIIPISSAKTIEEAIKLNHYTNFQPLESMKNLIKFNKT